LRAEGPMQLAETAGNCTRVKTQNGYVYKIPAELSRREECISELDVRIVTYPPPPLPIHFAAAATLNIITVPATKPVAIDVGDTPSRIAPTNAHVEKGT